MFTLLFLSCLTGAQVATALPLHVANDATCNFGPTHHSHLVLPTSSNLADCQLPSSTFLMSHGATFFCPHTFDVKLLATIDEDAARVTLCETHFTALAHGHSSQMVLRPTLPAGGLPALSRGQMASWTSPVMYHVHNFGANNAAGPDDGWNVTTVRNKTTTIQVQRVLYGRLLDVQPLPSQLTYLAHNASGSIVLSHYISTSGSSGFDQILKVNIHDAKTPSRTYSPLRSTWPTYLTMDGRSDIIADVLAKGDIDIAGTLHIYDGNGLPQTQKVVVTVTLDYYLGASDGFAGFGTMCATKAPQPQSPTTCGMGEEDHSFSSSPAS